MNGSKEAVTTFLQREQHKTGFLYKSKLNMPSIQSEQQHGQQQGEQTGMEQT
jgi:hypothetical protein